MQNWILKFLPIFTLLLSLTVNTQASPAETLAKADSLFSQKRYTQSLELYKELFTNNHFTPAMLLKMAFIEEGLGRNATALFYLNLYQYNTNDPTVQFKMEELANKNNLKGYTSSEIDRVWFLYKKYETYVLMTLLVICCTFFAIAVHHKRKEQPATAFWVLALIFAIPVLWLNNSRQNPDYGIIAKSQTYIMDGPSAGASVLDITSAGHRVKVLDKNDVWIKVSWENQIGYIKENSLLRITP